MNVFTVSLFGHREMDDLRQLDDQLSPIIKEIIRIKPYVTLLIGRNGDFDIYAATVVKRVQKAMGKENNELICVLPYSQKDIEYYEKYYDSVIIPECIGRTHPKGAITKRNRWMVEQADLFLCYIERKNGGAYTALQYAKKLKKSIINLAQKEREDENER